MENMRQFQEMPPEFNPLRDVRFREKALCDLDKEELLAALCQALVEIKRLSR